MTQFNLFKTRRFFPLFLTQFFGAFNDNLFKNALLVAVAFGLIKTTMSAAVIINLAAGLFILPFFLFSALAGKLADKYDKSRLIVILKWVELIVMLLAMVGLYLNSLPILLMVLFMLGVQAAFFGPLKYAILPTHLKDNELVGGNALIESGTFIAILLGTILAGVVVSWDAGAGVREGIGAWIYVAILGIVCAGAGLYSAKFIPTAPSVNKEIKIGYNIFKQTMEAINIARQTRAVWLSILGISWFWFVGASLLSQFPILVKSVLHAPASVVTLFLTIFSLGIGVGSILCEKLSGNKIEIGLVPFGSIGMTIFSLDLYFAIYAMFPPMSESNTVLITDFFFNSLSQFVSEKMSWRILIDLFLLSVFSGFFIVPLYALVQSRSAAETRSQVIGANNIINALFMVGSAAIGAISAIAGYTTLQFILFVSLCNAIVAIYIYSLVPEFLMRFVVWIFTHTIYRVKKNGLENIPETGAAIIVCNHVSFFDAFVIASCVPRPPKFVMYYKIYNIPGLTWMFKAAGAIPIAGKNENTEIFNSAFDKIKTALEDGQLVVIFPEGAITNDGIMQEFKPGILKILQTHQVPVIPSALSGLWGSMWSRSEKSLIKRIIPKSFFTRKLTYSLAAGIAPAELTNNHDLSRLRSTVAKLII